MESPERASYEFIEFIRKTSSGKTERYTCQNRRSAGELGEVKYYGAWRQYCYFPTAQAVYSKGCLDDISHFVARLNAIQRGQAGLFEAS